MSVRYINPDEAIHPLRLDLTEDDWERLDRIVLGGEESCTAEELNAYQDWLYDEIASKLQTHEGVTTLQ
jgi:hypothetical protein